MGKLFKKHFWTILIVIAALGLAGSAAYFSISGLSKLFAGSALQIIIMASFIEFSKLATTAALHRYWKDINFVLKSVLTFMVIIIMLITSMGIYGFLADAYSSTSTKLDKVEGEISLIEKNKIQKTTQIKSFESIKTSKSDRINSLTNLRSQQETRIDALYEKNKGVKGVQNMIEQSNKDIQTLQVEVDTLVAQIGRVNGEISKMDSEILELKSSDVATEIGPLKYMSNVINRPIESIINWFILAIIGVFDPLAVLLVILASTLYDKSNKKEEESFEEEKEFEEDIDYEESPTKEEFTQMLQDQSDVDSGGKIKLYPTGEEGLVEELNQKENYFNAIDSVNNSESDTNDFSYDSIPQEKNDEVVEYIEGENGNFEKIPSKEIVNSLIDGIDSNPLYLQLIDVLFLNGSRVPGDIIPPYKTLVKDISDSGIECGNKVIKNFLTICNLFDITNMKDKYNERIVKDYNASKEIISLVSK